MPFEGPLREYILRLFSEGRPQDARSGHFQDVRSGRHRDSRIGCLGDVLWTLDEDILGSSWGPIFAGWASSISNEKMRLYQCYPNIVRDTITRRKKLFWRIYICERYFVKEGI